MAGFLIFFVVEVFVLFFFVKYFFNFFFDLWSLGQKFSFSSIFKDDYKVILKKVEVANFLRVGSRARLTTETPNFSRAHHQTFFSPLLINAHVYWTPHLLRLLLLFLRYYHIGARELDKNYFFRKFL